MSKRTTTAIAVRAAEDGPVVWLASSPDRARDGLRIPVEAWDTTAFEKQGSPLMWAHRYDEPPVGKVIALTKSSEGLIAETIFTDITERARETERLVRAGFLNCCSVGFEILESRGDVVTAASLTELSVVPIGSDTNAVALARSAYARVSNRQRFDRDEDDPAVFAALLNLRSRFLEAEAARIVSPERIRAMVKDELIARAGR